jgi:hypothetical protein
MQPEPDDEDFNACGYSWDHTVREGSNECYECGAELDDLDEQESVDVD